MDIRPGVPADRAALADLWVEAWAIAMPRIDFEARRAWFDTHLDHLAAAGHEIWVAAEDGGPVGFVTVEPLTGTIDQLAVAIAAQGRGYALALLEAARTRSPQGLSLVVNSDNARAVRFYRRAGFVATGTGINTRSGLPTLLMRWSPDP